MGQRVHVLPIRDIVEHQDSDECVCGPDVECVPCDDAPDGWLITHHSLDGRERYEHGA
jgi:hypothetical protein